MTVPTTMDDEKHTPGPWVLDGHNLSAVLHCLRERGHPEAKHTCGDYEQIAIAYGDNWKANARLIVTAPDMLAALENLLALAEGMAITIDGEWGSCRSLEQLEYAGALDSEIIDARAVIAKVKGGT